MPQRATAIDVRSVTESSVPPLGVLVHDEWAEAFPWLVQGTTTAGRLADPFDLGLFAGGNPEDVVRRHWTTLAHHLPGSTIVHAKQPHGCDVRIWEGGPAAQEAAVPVLVDPCDGHVTDQTGVVLTVTVADCVPVSIVDPRRRVVAMVHAGWRGAAAGILEEAAATLRRRFTSGADDLHVHFGPAICGDCYEVGPEVHEALHQAVPTGPRLIDLRAILARRAASLGVVPQRLTVSTHCTLCGDAGLFSHRGGSAFRQVGYLGMRS